jgi:hypothetical protein
MKNSHWKIASSSATLMLLLLGCPRAGSGQRPGLSFPADSSQIVPLEQNKCPAVRPGETISLDWDFGFDDPAEVTGLRGVSLIFATVNQGGVFTHAFHPLSLGRPGPAPTPTRVRLNPDYSFHIDFIIPRGAVPGEYHLTSGGATAETSSGFSDTPRVSNYSPADHQFCLKVLPLQIPQTNH